MNNLKLKRITIVSDFAHFKKPYSGKLQETYLCPPPSTVIGILQNIFGEIINDFIFGYTFEYDTVFKDLQKIYKEINLKTKKLNDRYNKQKQWTSDVCTIKYLFNPKLVIYTNINEQFKINECLNLGKTDCLAKIVKIEYVDLIQSNKKGYNQWTDINVLGDGFPERVSIETKYNGKKGYYDIYTKLLKLNKEFEYVGYLDKDSEEIIYLWDYKKVGEINVFS